MKLTEQALARKYAEAFLQVYHEQVTRELIGHIQDFVVWYQQHRKAFFYLGLAHVSGQLKADAFLRACEPFHIHSLLRRLIIVLAEQGRLTLAVLVLQEILRAYRKLHHLVLTTVYSSHELAPEERTKIQQFLTQSTGKQVQVSYVHEPALIAGIRLQSDTFLWEHSIAQQLREFAAYAGK